ncbi:MAG TPA: DUF3035 domain-containing protein [Candidatus Acidoferrum sp.]|nr:DUF3035 domain-containing protein [Candidatus Acidoferrum sp.]
MRSNAWIGLVAIGAALALVGCSSSGSQPLGATPGSPGESLPLAHAPLTLPPDYSLRPGAPSQGSSAAEQAQTPLDASNGGAVPATGDTASGQAQSPGEVALLQNAGAAGIDPGVRAQINSESAAQIERDPELISRLALGASAPQGGTTIITTRKRDVL